MAVEGRLRELGEVLPTPAAPLASYVPVTVTGNLAFVSGQVPLEEGRLLVAGRLGADVDIQDGVAAARRCVLQALAALKAELGTLDRIRRVVKVSVFVASAEGFTDQPKVANGASDLLVEVFGDMGRHARSAVGVAELPLGAPVEVEVTVEIGP
jgi:enamine deaminase RidA (YjgF/YER057c/UK114 family)